MEAAFSGWRRVHEEHASEKHCCNDLSFAPDVEDQPRSLPEDPDIDNHHHVRTFLRVHVNQTTIQTLKLPDLYAMIAKRFKVSLHRARSDDICELISSHLHFLVGHKPNLSNPTTSHNFDNDVENLAADFFGGVSDDD